MTCNACTDAMTAPRSAEFTCGCSSCDARALAATGAHQESARVESITPAYRAALVALFGAESAEWMAGHEAVKAWDARMRVAK